MKDQSDREPAPRHAETPRHPERAANGGYKIDLTAAFELLREQLRAELLAEVRQHCVAVPEYMDVNAAARLLGVSPERVRKLIAGRRIPFHQEGPGCRVFLSRRDLISWMDSQRHEALR